MSHPLHAPQHPLPSFPSDGSAGLRARVSRVDRGMATVVPSTDDPAPVRLPLGPAVLAAAAADPVASPCVGDWVVLGGLPEQPRVEAVLPRRTALVRTAVSPGASHGQVLAANVDVVLVVEPLLPEPDLGRIERLLALAWASGARPVVILTKADLVGDVQDQVEDVARVAPGADVWAVSVAADAAGRYALDPLRELLTDGATAVLLGPSGAGKSSLTNALAGQQVMDTRALRGDQKGRHTTVHRELIRLPGGGLIIDTPGLRRVDLPADAALDSVFADLDALADDCRFHDCAHDGEPGCAVVAAVEEGTLPLRRLESWRKLQREAAYLARRTDARLAAEERKRWKQRSAESRRSGRNRP